MSRPEETPPSSRDRTPLSAAATRAGDRKFEMALPIAAPRDAVWKAIAEARELERWFAPTASITPGVGGRVTWKWGDLHTWEQTVEVWEPGRHLRTRYDSSVDDGRGGRRPLFVDFHLEGDRGTTMLRIVHSGFGPESDFDAEYDGISGGWPVELRSLRLYLEHHRGVPRQLAWTTRSSQEPPEIVWRRLVGDAGLAAPGLPSLREGERFSVAVGDAGSIEGTALVSPTSREFSGVAENLGRGWMRIHCERWGGATQVWLWLALYGQPEARVRSFQRAFERILDRVAPGAECRGGAEAEA